MTDVGAVRRAWERRRDHPAKPRVSWCAMTRKWIVSPSGSRHTCGRSWKPDTAFRYWADAMDEANLIAWERIKSAVAHDVWYGK